jgi:hypothetical protein
VAGVFLIGAGTTQTPPAAGRGAGPHVRVFDGTTGQPLAGTLGSFYAYNASFSGGVFVASADVNGDGRDDIITGAGAGGGPHVRVFSGLDGAELFSFYAYHPKLDSGVSVAAGDVNGDGRADVITGPGAGTAPLVKVFSGLNGSELSSFNAYSPLFTGGVFVAAGDLNGNGHADIYTGAGPGGGPHVRIFDGANHDELQSFFAYAPSFAGGVRVAAADLDGDGLTDIITGAGPSGGPHVRGLSGVNLAELNSFFAYDPSFAGGVFVAGSTPIISGTVLRLSHDAPAPVAGSESLTAEQLDRIRAAAIGRWQAAALPSAESDLLADVRLAVATLPGDLLGVARDGSVLIDADAAGQGWFVDPTPETDEEFAFGEEAGASERATSGRVDLLTVLLHEFGHVLGLDDNHGEEGAMPLMLGELELGVRRLPTRQLVDAALENW